MSGARVVVALVATLSLFPGGAASQDTPSPAELVQGDVSRITEALYSGDVDTVLEFTHPRIIELLGGEGPAREALAASLAKLLEIGMTLEVLEFPGEPTFVPTEAHEYVVVPTKSVIAANGQQVLSLNFQFGARAKGAARWSYVEGSRLSQEVLDAWFPDFPDGFAFPEVSRTRN